MKRYAINECFYSPQGEGHRSGTMNVFLRFAGCNLQCVDGAKLGRGLRAREVDAGFNCDTDFAKGTKLTISQILELIDEVRNPSCKWIILTGGEPTLQIDEDLISALRGRLLNIALETNGTNPVPMGVDWVSCSPKPGTRDQIRVKSAHEVRCVIKPGQEPDAMGILADHYFVSPACSAPTADKISGFHGSLNDFDREAMAWAVRWCGMHPQWRISLQMHKILQVR